jgi:anti-sigma regulatory factor (Ser/Thr protein kinase)
MTVDSDVCPRVGDHSVQFYASDDALIDVVVGYVGSALREGDAGLVIATPGHREGIEAGLVAVGVDTSREKALGRLVILDAAETLAEFTVDGRLDRTRFTSVVGDVLRGAAAGGRHVRAYGEMVEVLWEAGDVAGALQLEELWNELREKLTFSLLCGYASELVESAECAASFWQVCAAHSHVVEGAPAPVDAEVSRRFVGNVHGPRLARRFVREVLHDWGHADLVEPVLLVTSELATNAVRYCGSDFTVSMSRDGHGVTVAVGDNSRLPPQPRTAAEWETGGRGLCLVEKSAREWGHREAGNGKLVWAHVVPGGEHVA